MAVSLRKTKTSSGDEAEGDALIAKWVETSPAHPSVEEARIVGHGTPVAIVINYLQSVDWDFGPVIGEYGLPAEAVAAAVAYYERHRVLIDAAILVADAPFSGYDFNEDAAGDPLIARWIETGPVFDTPDEARVKDCGVRVRVLIAYLNHVEGDQAETARAYAVSEEAVAAAVAYYERHRALIDAAIVVADASFSG